MDVNIHSVKESSSLLNFGHMDITTEFMQMKFGQNQLSSWTQYPDSYKFYSVTFQLSQDTQETYRKRDDLLKMASNVGGFSIIIFRIFGFIVGQFSHLRMKSLIISRLFFMT